MGVHVADDEAAVEAIAHTLSETEERPLTQIKALVRVLGREGAMQLLEETQAVEAGGGMMLPNGARRRTPGGVFFFLARRKLSKEDQLAIFGAPPRPPAAQAPAPARPAPAAQPKPPPSERSLPRRRVVDVFEMRRHAPVERRPLGALAPSSERESESRAQGSREGTVIEDLARSENRSRVREQVRGALAPLEARDRHLVLIELLADLHGRGYVATAPEPPPAPPPVAASRTVQPAAPVEAPARIVPVTKARPTSSARPSRPSAPEREPAARATSARSKVLETIRRRPGISTAELAEKVFGDDTEVERRKVSAITAALKSEGKIRSAGRGRFELDD